MEPVTQAIERRPQGTVVQSASKAVGQTQIMSGENPWTLIAEMNKLANKGQIRIIRRTPWQNAQTGHWEVVVRRLKNPPPRWRKPVVLVGSGLIALGVVGWFGTMLADTTVGRVLFASVATIALIAVGGWVTTLGQRGRHAAVDVRVEVKVR